MSVTRLENRIAEVAAAAGKNVYVGRKGHNDDWFAGCDGVEFDGPSAMAALESVVNGLKTKATQEAREAETAATRSSRLGAL